MSEQRALLQPWWVRPALAGAVLVVALLTLVLNNCWCDQDRLIGRLALVAVVCASWFVELLRAPLPRLGFAASTTLPIAWLIYADNASVAPLFLLLVVGWVVYTGQLWEGLLATALAIVSILGYVHFDSPDRWLPWILGISATGLMMRMVVVQQSLVQQLRVAQADLARQAVAAERRRIAGEIHDVAAHSLAVTLLHLTGARLRVQREHGQAWLVEALAEAERLGRQTLDDVRRTVGLLQDSANGTAPPLPGAVAISDLIEEYRAAGLAVSFGSHGDAAGVPAATGLALYRITQEALANAVKHAPGAPVEVLLEVGGHTRVSIRNPLPAQVAAATDRGTGLGIGGMRERARLLGGSLNAAADDRGWLVECTIPRDD